MERRVHSLFDLREECSIITRKATAEEATETAVEFGRRNEFTLLEQGIGNFVERDR